jgi:hypothetical protein
VAPPKPYKPVAVTPAKPASDPSFEAFRKQLADIASRKDRAALARLVAPNFFRMGESGDKADKKKSGIDNLAAAIDLDAKDGSGWETLAGAADEPTLEPVPERKGVMCSTASPRIDETAFEQLIKATGTDVADWGYPSQAGLEVRASAQANAPVIERLGLHLVRILPEEAPGGAQPTAPQQNAPSVLRVVTPAGKAGFVSDEAIAPLIVDQFCYVKDASGWKIAGFVGGD